MDATFDQPVKVKVVQVLKQKPSQVSIALSNNQFSSQASNYGNNKDYNNENDYSTDAGGVASTLNDFSELHKLGDGSYSQVYLMRRKKD